MYTGKTLFAQLMDFLPWTSFARIVERYGGDRYAKSLRCAEHFRVMAFAQLSYRESLRDIEACLSAQASKLYHMGFREPIRRSTLSDANEARDWRIYADFAQVLIRQARKLYAAESFGVELRDRLVLCTGEQSHRFPIATQSSDIDIGGAGRHRHRASAGR